MKRLAPFLFWSVFFWSVLGATFLGPGTVVTCASSGARYGDSLLWALTFSIVATALLQEASARLTVVSGYNLGQALRRTYRTGGLGVLLLVAGAILVGCAACQAGNLLGAVTGIALATGVEARLLILLCGAAAAVLLWFGTPKRVACLLGLTVAVLGGAFLFAAYLLHPPVAEVVKASLVPSFPPESGLLILGLVGTMVPYNLFLGSWIAQGQKLSELRFGIAVAVVLGGLFSVCILVAGGALRGQAFSFEAVAAVLGARLGIWAARLFEWGLFAAGFLSVLAAPLAAALTARGLFEAGGGKRERWGDRSWRFRAVWMLVLAFGLACGLSGMQPIPAILLAQALNGVLLPLVATFLFLVVNDRRLVGEEGLNGAFSNTLMVAVVVISLILGVTNLARGLTTALKLRPPSDGDLLIISGGLALILIVPVVRAALARRRVPPAALPRWSS